MKQESFWDLYNDILSEPNKWCYYHDLDYEINAKNIFDGNNALNFIESVFTRGGKENAVNIPHYDDFEITEDVRITHYLHSCLVLLCEINYT